MVEMGGGGGKAESKRIICRCYVGKAVGESLVHVSEGVKQRAFGVQMGCCSQGRRFLELCQVVHTFWNRIR